MWRYAPYHDDFQICMIGSWWPVGRSLQGIKLSLCWFLLPAPGIARLWMACLQRCTELWGHRLIWLLLLIIKQYWLLFFITCPVQYKMILGVTVFLVRFSQLSHAFLVQAALASFWVVRCHLWLFQSQLCGTVFLNCGNSQAGSFTGYFLVPKRGEGLCPILDLR